MQRRQLERTACLRSGQVGPGLIATQCLIESKGFTRVWSIERADADDGDRRTIAVGDGDSLRVGRAVERNDDAPRRWLGRSCSHGQVCDVVGRDPASCVADRQLNPRVMTALGVARLDDSLRTLGEHFENRVARARAGSEVQISGNCYDISWQIDAGLFGGSGR